MDLVGLGDDEELATSAGRVARRGEVDDHVRAWIAARPAAEVLDAFTKADAAIAPVLTMAQLLADPHVIARELFIDVDGNPMQNVVARLSATPGRIRWAGREEGPA
jgi:crotonobetainyl-CoA:carnitine CoA-transferase CaiB-like acyl-CoA transferase